MYCLKCGTNWTREENIIINECFFCLKTRKPFEIDEDIEQIEELRQQAKEGDSEAQYLMATYYATGTNVGKNMQKATYYYRKASEQSHDMALIGLGRCYQFGLGIEKSLENAVSCYEAVVTQNNHPLALYHLAYCYENGIVYQVDMEKAFQLYEEAAQSGVEEANYSLGLCYEMGLGTEENFEQAKFYYESGVDEEVADCFHALGDLYEYGKGCQVNLEKALFYYEESAKLESSVGAQHAGRCYEDGIGTSIDLFKARDYYQLAADLGNWMGDSCLVSLYQNEEEFDVSSEEIAERVRSSAVKGNRKALYDTAMSYLHGLLFPEDFDLALLWLKKAGEAGDRQALKDLSCMYYFGVLYGRTVEIDGVSAAYWLKKLAELGSSYSDNYLGTLYEFGEGVTQSYKRALYHYEKAAQKDNIEALQNLVRCLSLDHKWKDEEKAVLWKQKLKEEGEKQRESLYEMAERYLPDTLNILFDDFSEDIDLQEEYREEEVEVWKEVEEELKDVLADIEENAQDRRDRIFFFMKRSAEFGYPPAVEFINQQKEEYWNKSIERTGLYPLAAMYPFLQLEQSEVINQLIGQFSSAKEENPLVSDITNQSSLEELAKSLTDFMYKEQTEDCVDLEDLEDLEDCEDLEELEEMKVVGTLQLPEKYDEIQVNFIDYLENHWMEIMERANIGDTVALNQMGYYYYVQYQRATLVQETDLEQLDQGEDLCYSAIAPDGMDSGRSYILKHEDIVLYRSNQLVETFGKFAVDNYKKSAKLNNKDAWYFLGILYETGIYVMEDKRKAWVCYLKACELGHSQALFVCGQRYRSGEFVPQNYEKMLSYLQKAVEKNHPQAMYTLADCYKQGIGVPVDLEESEKLEQRGEALGGRRND